jgi:hypothetical protein
LKRDLRKFAKKTNIRLVIGFIILLIFVGDGLIYLIYGSGAAVTGLLCILGGLAPLILIAGLMLFLDFVVKKANDE